MKKKKLLGISLALVSAGAAVATLALSPLAGLGQNVSNVKGTSHILTIPADLSDVKTTLGNQVCFVTEGYNVGTFATDGYIANTTEILATQTVTVSVTSGKLTMYFGYDGIHYYVTNHEFNANSASQTWDMYENAGYFKLVATEPAVISQVEVVYSCGTTPVSIPDGFCKLPVDYPTTKVYDATAAEAPYVGPGVTVSWQDSGGTAIDAAPSAVGTYKLVLTNSAKTTIATFVYKITAYTTDVFVDHPGIGVTMDVNGDAYLKKGESGEMIFNGWWRKLIFDGLIVPAGATGMTLHMKAKTAVTAVSYSCSYPGVSLGSGTIASIGTDYSDIAIPLSANFCKLTNLNILIENNDNPLTVDKITFTPASSYALGKTGIFNTGTPVNVTADSGTTLSNCGTDDALVLTGAWWCGFSVDAGAVAIPLGVTKVTITMRSNLAYGGVLIQLASQDETLNAAVGSISITTSAVAYDFTLTTSTVASSLKSLKVCVCDDASGLYKYVAISSVVFS